MPQRQRPPVSMPLQTSPQTSPQTPPETRLQTPALPTPADARVQDWDLLFRAVLARLRQAVDAPADPSATLRDCIDALDSLRTMALALLQPTPTNARRDLP